MVINQSAGPYSPNSMIKRDDIKGFPLDNMSHLREGLLKLHHTKPNQTWVWFKSDVAKAYRMLPIHPLWQIKQVVTIDGERDIDRNNCFGGRGSPGIYISFHGLTIWIARMIVLMESLWAYMDDSFGIDEEGNVIWYHKYDQWSWEHLVQECAIMLGQAIDISTWNNYGSTLNSYLTFVQIHMMPVEPTADTLSLYTVYMCHHIKPKSIDTYLSGICQQLKPYFVEVQEIRKSHLVHQTLVGCKWLRGTPTNHKHALTIGDLNSVCAAYQPNPSHDDLLFCTQLCMGFFALMCLGELTCLDDLSLRDPHKCSQHESMVLHVTSVQFFLPGHKANRFL
jgi:hypothetical protein